MKTKIMLASAVVLAVALVGTARPAVGIEKTAATTTVVETAAPAPVSLAVVLPAPAAQEKKAEQAVVQEKEKEKAKAAEKEKAVIEKKIVVTTKDGAKTPIEITITEGDTVKTLVFDKPLTITRGEGGHVLVLSSDGKDIQVRKGEPLSLVFTGGAVELLKEGKALKVGEGGAYKIIREGDKEGSQVVVYWTPEVRPAKGQEILVIKEGEAVEAGVKVVVGKAIDVSPTIVWTVKEPGKEGQEGAVWVTKEFSGKPVEGAWMSEGSKAFAISPARDKELLDKVHKLREQAEAVKAKKMDIDVLQKSLEKLEMELKAKEEKLHELKMKFEKAPGEVTVVKKIREGEGQGDVVFEKRDEEMAAGKGGTWVAKADQPGQVYVSVPDDTINLVFTAAVGGGLGAADFEQAVAKLKKELPEGYKILEQKLDAENGVMTFKISPPQGAKVDGKLIRKIVDSVRVEVKTKK